jgi:hypothetical protein
MCVDLICPQNWVFWDTGQGACFRREARRSLQAVIQLLLMNKLGPLFRRERLTAEQFDGVQRQVQSINARTATNATAETQWHSPVYGSVSSLGALTLRCYLAP